MSDETMLSAKEVAAKLKMDPKRFRALLRKINGKAPGERYAFKPTDPFLKKLPQLIKQQEKKKHQPRRSRAVSPTVNSMWAFWCSNKANKAFIEVVRDSRLR